MFHVEHPCPTARPASPGVLFSVSLPDRLRFGPGGYPACA